MGQQFSWEEAEAAGELDVAELQDWYKKFVVECPSGTLFMHEFKSFFKVEGNEEAMKYVEGMFRAFDRNEVRWDGSGIACTPLLRGPMFFSPELTLHHPDLPAFLPSSLTFFHHSAFF